MVFSCFKEIIEANKYFYIHDITQTGCHMTEETMKHQHCKYMPEHAPMGVGDRIIYISLQVLSLRSSLILYTKREREGRFQPSKLSDTPASADCKHQFLTLCFGTGSTYYFFLKIKA